MKALLYLLIQASICDVIHYHFHQETGTLPEPMELNERNLAVVNGQTIALECLGGEKGKYLSHAYNKVWLQNGIQGAGEHWKVELVSSGKWALRALGAENGKYLSHAFAKIWL